MQESPTGRRPLRILTVSYPYPPMPTVGGNRWLAMSKYLRRLGHEVEILTTSAFGALPDDAENGVTRVGDLIASPRLRSLLRRPPLPEPGQAAVVDRPLPPALSSVLVPDIYVATWVPQAIAAARAMQRRRPFDAITTTSAYESAHLIPLGMGRSRPAWVADFRDGWTFQSHRPGYPTGLQRGLDRRLEAKVVRSAEGVAVVEPSVGRDFRERLADGVAHIPNGWDPDLEVDTAGVELPDLPTGRRLLVHTGKLSGAWGRDPGNLFAALGALRDSADPAYGKIALVLAGRLDESEQRQIAAAGLEEVVFHVGHLSRAASLALQRRADGLLLLTSSSLSWELPGKLFEYLGARRPVFALAESNDAAELVEETGVGVTVSPDDVGAIAAGLRRFAAGQFRDAYRPRGLERFIYPAPAEAMAGLIRSAVDRRTRRG